MLEVEAIGDARTEDFGGIKLLRTTYIVRYFTSFSHTDSIDNRYRSFFLRQHPMGTGVARKISYSSRPRTSRAHTVNKRTVEK